MIFITIKSLRIGKNMTQKELANLLKIDQSAIAQWETGRSSPDKKRLIELATILECTIEDLLKSDDESEERKEP